MGMGRRGDSCSAHPDGQTGAGVSSPAGLGREPTLLPAASSLRPLALEALDWSEQSWGGGRHRYGLAPGVRAGSPALPVGSGLGTHEGLQVREPIWARYGAWQARCWGKVARYWGQTAGRCGTTPGSRSQDQEPSLRLEETVGKGEAGGLRLSPSPLLILVPPQPPRFQRFPARAPNSTSPCRQPLSQC